jgi:hypothetical protein
MHVKYWLGLAIIAAGLSVPAAAANIKLYLKDGTYQLVREYLVLSDRVKFYSSDRADWEEMPLVLVDLKKTANAYSMDWSSVQEVSVGKTSRSSTSISARAPRSARANGRASRR